ncbi:hypothetical protein [Microcoleus sp. D3_18a_C4]|uniref:hypothetical protein n=1 Tax=Microcoleus sp. D3_18a_C4 TaxID=3055332 RepID=UPI002FCEED58
MQFVDEAVYTNTGKRLNNLQRKIISGILNRQRYADVAETYDYSSQHVKKASHELLQMLSEVFGEQVKKSNLESVLERHINLNITFGNENNINKNIIGIGCINNCPEPSTPTPDKSQPENPDLQQQKSKNQTKIETIDKLRQFGLSDEQIAEALNIPLEQVKQVDLEE